MLDRRLNPRSSQQEERVEEQEGTSRRGLHRSVYVRYMDQWLTQFLLLWT